MLSGLFVDRLFECFGTSNLAEVARRTGVPYNTLKNYTGENRRIPSTEVLLQIYEKTGIDLHWLMTGKQHESRNSSEDSKRQTITPEGEITLTIPEIRIRVQLDRAVGGGG